MIVIINNDKKLSLLMKSMNYHYTLIIMKESEKYTSLRNFTIEFTIEYYY